MADYKSRVSRGLYGKEQNIKKENKNEVSHTSPACHRGQVSPRCCTLARALEAGALHQQKCQCVWSEGRTVRGQAERQANVHDSGRLSRQDSLKKANRGARHLLTVLTCFLSRKQMQVHTREAIKRKALIPICNCFSISTSLLHRAEVRQHFISSVESLAISPYLFLSLFSVRTCMRLRVYVSVRLSLSLSPFCTPLRVANRERELLGPARAGNRKPRENGLFTAAYRKQTITPPRSGIRSRRESA